VVSGPERR
jgi:hypothetical protein